MKKQLDTKPRLVLAKERLRQLDTMTLRPVKGGMSDSDDTSADHCMTSRVRCE